MSNDLINYNCHMNDTKLVESDARDGGHTKDSAKTTLREIVTFVLIAALIFVPIRMFVVEPYIVDGTSMDPTFATGDYLMVDRISYRFHEPSRFDVIVTKNPINPKTYLIKRIIGLPGERVMISQGKVSVMTQYSNVKFETGAGIGTTTGGGGVVSQSLDEPYVAIQHVSHDDFDVTLTPTQYFVMGDNRAESADSRLWGPLESKFIVGRPILRLLPISKVDIKPGDIEDFNIKLDAKDSK